MTDGANLSSPWGQHVRRLLSVLDLEQIEDNIFRGCGSEPRWDRLFGGQVLGQALAAATRTVPEERLVHSLHAYFLLPGDGHAPVVYEVDRARDGGSFTTRRVVAIQHGKPIFNMAASFQKAEGGFEHQSQMPEVPGPDALPASRPLAGQPLEKVPDNRRPAWLRESPFEVRAVESHDLQVAQSHPPVRNLWFRLKERVSDDEAFHRILAAYVSDYALVTTALLPHSVVFPNPGLMVSSLDHALWIHEPFRVDEWFLYAQDSPRAISGRGFCRGSIYTQDGRLVASVAQEGLFRTRAAPR